MAKRSKARQVAVQMLYQADLNADVDGRMVRDMIADRLSDESLRDFTWGLFTGVMEHRGEIDARIQEVAENWKLSRMAATDRAVIRLGAFELLKTNVPVGVVIDEAIELAKKFGSGQSSQFVNGVLDRLVPEDRRRQERPRRPAVEEAPPAPDAGSSDPEPTEPG